MKSIKASIAAIATLASTIAFGGGLYIVSGGDFRTPYFSYILDVPAGVEVPIFEHT